MSVDLPDPDGPQITTFSPYLISGEPRAPVTYLVHANFTEVVHGARRRADDDARRRRGGIAAVLLLCVDEFAEPVRVLEGLVMYKPHRAAHQMGRAERLGRSQR